MSPIQKCSLDKIIPYFQLEKPLDWSMLFENPGPLVVEIGFGWGEVLLKRSQEDTKRNFVGIEQVWDRVYKTIRRMTLNEEKAHTNLFGNVRILDVDARSAFRRLFDEKTIQEVYSYFPCPWPKKGHVKHRLFSSEFLKLLNNRLEDHGRLHVITDHAAYADWIEEQVDSTGFILQRNSIHSDLQTKFERKWKEGGQEEFYELDFIKTQHFHAEVDRELEMKAFKVENFDPNKFQMKEKKGEVSIVFKDMLFDAQRGRALVYLIVSEGDMSQHFRVSVKKLDDGWRVCKAQGQQFFATPGIVQSIELVYRSIKESCE